ncbi:M20 family metallo-hydrolase [Thermophagus sp. OGC60D27]|uniref:M20 family metallo-hydrolase n=1 Tax=Thermophagus sp. OGC60D27 TaxID=3458415 RepID=UPI00403841CE
MISVPSFSREEGEVASMVEDFLKESGLKYYQRKGNNIWIRSKNFSDQLPVVLLNSHLDTVRPSSGWDTDPFTPCETEGKIIGLGSNDAGASVVAMLAVFRMLEETEQRCNFIFSATAEEEISGDGGVASVLGELGPIDLGIVGEPTQMQMAVAEKGLMVIDGLVRGKSGHAARNEGINAIYEALPVIQWFRNYQFPKVSDFLGPVKMTVTGLEAGTQHNVVPDVCRFMVDVRVNEHYKNRELFDLICKNVDCELKARSFRLNSSSIPNDHPFVRKGEELGLHKFGSPTTSDQARMPFTTVKIGPGDSARSHTPNEYVHISEIIEGVEIYFKLLNGLNIYPV